ncbi:putative ATP-binding endoribonuclease [Drechmeria coniospora]|uniref:Diphthine--ammonia ligase n=1 Tax=Drechmeria coniospora TaxID=98403 RepID=A0A151GMD1_DRECN|nr:putative ATP-binding endoribonuclease [Drechmeria coniospora]KYK58273.1 putative ATP-binding endoribonuclease [Drechmeria coniospora]
MPNQGLNVIALVSGGKDSFYSLLHCLHHGHRVVALANLFPDTATSASLEVVDPDAPPPAPRSAAEDRDLDSFMYQTVGHQVIPLYAAATGIPLYRQPILGAAVRRERDYDYDDDAAADAAPGAAPADETDETESMMPLLRAVMARHPEADALCSGAILSTYQRSRVESVALRLGLVPLSYLWKYPALSPGADEAQLLRDMAGSGLEARIVKVASAGLDETHLWTCVTSAEGVGSVRKALRRFGATEGASLGEGGEFETMVVDGPSALFRRRISIPDRGRKPIRDGGGSTWLLLQGAHLEDKPAESGADLAVPEPPLLDARFRSILDGPAASLQDQHAAPEPPSPWASSLLRKATARPGDGPSLIRWSLLADGRFPRGSVKEEAMQIVGRIRRLLASLSLPSSRIANTLIVLRDMADFPDVNVEYGKLFPKPNPPSRVTVSCGDLLPPGRNLLIHVTLPGTLDARERRGLHVQSRSYWAPANIGPYSQAIDVPMTARSGLEALRAVYVAGQIPLIPASMLLPPPSDACLWWQVVLSLQHLWRIGVEMKVQCWTSAVAYFSPSPSSAGGMKERAELAGRAWNLAHAPSEEDEDEEGGPDLWDLKYNPQYMSFGSGDAASSHVALPDWSVFSLRQQNNPASCIPPLFAVEMESLPRGSDVEWHAHMGLRHPDEGSVEMVHQPAVGPGDWTSWHVVVRSSSLLIVHTVIACRWSGGDRERAKFEHLEEAMGRSHRESLASLGLHGASAASDTPHLSYIDLAAVDSPWKKVEELGGNEMMAFAIVPCHSIWTTQGERLACVALYTETLSEAG